MASPGKRRRKKEGVAPDPVVEAAPVVEKPKEKPKKKWFKK